MTQLSSDLGPERSGGTQALASLSPGDWHPVCAQADVAEPSSRVTFTLPSGELCVVINHEDSLYALSALCTHRELPLSDGMIHRGQIVCPWHRARFDLKTGTGTRPAPGSLRIFEVAIINGTVCIRENQESQ